MATSAPSLIAQAHAAVLGVFGVIAKKVSSLGAE